MEDSCKVKIARLWRLISPQRGQGNGEAKDEERWGRRGVERDRRRWRMGWEVRGEGSDFRGAVDWGRRVERREQADLTRRREKRP